MSHRATELQASGHLASGLGRFFRRISPLLVIGMGVCFLKERRRRWRARCRRHEERQEEMLATLREIRDSVKKQDAAKPL